jgi:hypothetical protein
LRDAYRIIPEFHVAKTLIQAEHQRYESADAEEDDDLLNKFPGLNCIEENHKKRNSGQIIEGEKDRAHYGAAGASSHGIDDELVDVIAQEREKIRIFPKRDECRTEQNQRKQCQGLENRMIKI